MLLLIAYFEDIMTNTKELMDYSKQLREWSVSIARINRILNYSSQQQLLFGQNMTDDINGMVEFEHVSFSYPNNNKGRIQDISFTAKPNQMLAIVGHSGSGKTTILNLLLRKYKLDQGVILIDGENIYDYSKTVYAKNVVAVNQSPFLFSMSIRKNLSLIDSNVEHQI